MNIVHVIPSAPYNDYWGYQDNLLPKYQRRLGNEVTVFATNTVQKNGTIIEIEPSDYYLNDGVRVVRFQKKHFKNELITRLTDRIYIYDKLIDIKPDYIFFHGLVSTTIFDVMKYKKNINPNCIVVQDNHLDYNIGRGIKTLNDKIICKYYRIINRISIKYVDKVFGVTPWRKEYAEEYFGITKYKTDILIMGADDEKINFKNKEYIKRKVRTKYNLNDEDFLIVTGGKIDKKKNIDLLIEACKNKKGVKLLIFGELLAEIKDKIVHEIENSDNIIFVGWINSDDVYDYFLSCDLVVFPGQHSVLWEQACASKVPCLFAKWEGMEHVNNGGNSDFIFPVTVDNLEKKIDKLIFTEKYYEMKKRAESQLTDVYLYSYIAEKSLSVVKDKDV